MPRRVALDALAARVERWGAHRPDGWRGCGVFVPGYWLDAPDDDLAGLAVYVGVVATDALADADATRVSGPALFAQVTKLGAPVGLEAGLGGASVGEVGLWLMGEGPVDTVRPARLPHGQVGMR